jgi:hypothetical protein
MELLYKEAVEQILKEGEDIEFREVLKEQLNDYTNIANSAMELLYKEGKKVKDINAMSKIASYIGIKMGTLKSDSSSNLAEMMLKGSTMGITDITKHLNKYTNVDKEVRSLADKLLELEEDNIEALKPYL